jgi:hypothetical protein
MTGRVDRRHMLCPKPRVRPDFIPALAQDQLSWLAGELGPVERLAMREIVERGDLIHVDGVTYLVAPVSARCIDGLSAFEAEGEDRVNDLCDEPDVDYEPSEDPEPDNRDAPIPDYPDKPALPQYVNMMRGGHGSGQGRASPEVVNPATGKKGRIVPVG